MATPIFGTFVRRFLLTDSPYSTSGYGTAFAPHTLDMIPSLWRNTRTKNESKRRRQLDRRSHSQIEEESNREGHWYRDFGVRADSWILIENWAKTHGYRLIALKGRRRLYRKGSDPNGYSTFLDIRHEEGRVVMAGWIQAGFRVRAFYLFLLSVELPIEPLGGWKGIVVRRRACRDFNSLLFSLKQPPILGSDSFHVSDIDHSTLALSAFLLIPLHIFLAVQVLRVELAVGLSNLLLLNIANHLKLLLGVVSALIVVHHFAVVRFFQIRWVKVTSVVVCTGIFATMTVFTGTRTQTENLYSKMTYYCFTSVDQSRCVQAIEKLPLRDRYSLAVKFEDFKKNLLPRSSIR